MTVGLDAPAVENGSRRPRAFTLASVGERVQRVIEVGPLVVARPLPEDMIDDLPRTKVGGQITPLAATLDDIQDSIHDAPPIGGWAAAFSWFGPHGFEVSPLGLRETGVIYGVFTPQRGAALKIGRQKPKAYFNSFVQKSFSHHQTDYSNTDSSFRAILPEY
jgi:hypothetical protein